VHVHCGGQQQILALGRALVTRPDLRLLNEPSEAIQPSIVQHIAREIKDLNHGRGITAARDVGRLTGTVRR